MSEPKSDLEKGIEGIGRALEGVAGRILGPKAVGKDVLPEEPSISAETDRRIEALATEVEKLMHAAGKGLEAAPLNPAAAFDAAKAHREDEIEPPVGWSPLVGGARDLSRGLGKVAEGVLDKVAPKRGR